MTPLSAIVLILGGLTVLAVLMMVYLSVVLAWEDQRTRGLSYYGLAPPERERFKWTLRRHATLLVPLLRFLGRFSKFTFTRASFHYQGVAAPKGSCTPESFEAGHRYQPRPEDVFVVTQMRCGTTWMQHVVYQVLTRGSGDLVETGRTLYAVSPWLESVKSVSMTDAPLLGMERPSRVIKTHFPVALCPYSPLARYVYVARHPVSCLASCADFIASNLGSFTPSLDVIERWFCSEEAMWWGSWPAHVGGWWHLARQRENVLFVQFEEMKTDLEGVARRVAGFLGLEPLSDEELRSVVEKCGFGYMQRHQGTFEMHPPHLLALESELFKSGKEHRHRDVPEEMGRRIMARMVEQATRDELPIERLYPEGASLSR